MVGVARVGHALEVALRLKPDLLGPLIELLQRGGNIQLLRALRHPITAKTFVGIQAQLYSRSIHSQEPPQGSTACELLGPYCSISSFLQNFAFVVTSLLPVSICKSTQVLIHALCTLDNRVTLRLWPDQQY